MNDILPTKVNYTTIRWRLKEYCRHIKFGPCEEADKAVDDAMEQFRQWRENGFIYDDHDVDLSVDALKAQIRQKKYDAEGITKDSAKYGTICWTCYNAVPKNVNGRYISGCSWSRHLLPVEGWEAVKRGNGTCVVKCPLYING